jgi:hypothetical protein
MRFRAGRGSGLGEVGSGVECDSLTIQVNAPMGQLAYDKQSSPSMTVSRETSMSLR